MKLLFAILAALSSCAAIPVPAADSPAEAWRNARMVEAVVNGCGTPCPADDANCVDEYGLCWTPCGWRETGHDDDYRRALHVAALAQDPTRAFIIDCRRSVGQVEARR